jgi:DNA replication protein DnaC
LFEKARRVWPPCPWRPSRRWASPDQADRAAKSETTYTAYLGRLVELELADKADRSINARIARARFPVLRTLEQFDFNFQPSLSAARVRELASLTFLDQAVNVLFVGGPEIAAYCVSFWLCVGKESNSQLVEFDA